MSYQRLCAIVILLALAVAFLAGMAMSRRPAINFDYIVPLIKK